MSTAIRRSLPLALAGIVAIAFLAFLFRSCAGSVLGIQYNGKWTGNRHLPIGENQYAGYSAGEVDLTIRDNKFELSEGGIPTTGSVTYMVDRMNLHTETTFGLPLERANPEGAKQHPDITVTPNTDGTLLFDNPLAVDHKPLKLKRAK